MGREAVGWQVLAVFNHNGWVPVTNRIGPDLFQKVEAVEFGMGMKLGRGEVWEWKWDGGEKGIGNERCSDGIGN